MNNEQYAPNIKQFSKYKKEDEVLIGSNRPFIIRSVYINSLNKDPKFNTTRSWPKREAKGYEKYPYIIFISMRGMIQSKDLTAACISLQN